MKQIAQGWIQVWVSMQDWHLQMCIGQPGNVVNALFWAGLGLPKDEALWSKVNAL
jgi:hypothetical protein